MSFQNKVVLVTGASRGIGKVILLKFAQAGATVIGVNSNIEHASNLTIHLKELGLKGEGMSMDVSKQDSIESVLEQIKKRYGMPAILINNAAITRDNLVLRMSQEEWDQVIATNLTSIFRLTRICLRDMLKARFGRIINITSIVACIGNPGQANYAAAKAGVIAFSKSLALEVASRNITVNCVAPGYIATQMTEELTEERKEKLLSMIPMKRIGTSADVANAVTFLAGENASYITGSTLHVNGGMAMI